MVEMRDSVFMFPPPPIPAQSLAPITPKTAVASVARKAVSTISAGLDEAGRRPDGDDRQGRSWTDAVLMTMNRHYIVAGAALIRILLLKRRHGPKGRRGRHCPCPAYSPPDSG